MTKSRVVLAAAAAALLVGALASCDRVGLGGPDSAKPTVTVTTTLSDEPSPTAEQTSEPTTTTTAPPATTSLPPGGSGLYTAVDSSRFTLNPPTSVAYYAFSVPSSNIRCFIGSEFICEIHDGPNQSPVASRCGFYEGDSEERVRIVGWFKYDRPPCSTILQGTWRDPGPVLNYGESVHFSASGAEFTCYSSNEALYCTGPQNYGFRLSRTEFARYELS